MITEGAFYTKDNLNLYCKSWVTKNAKANILFAHGFFEHCNRYESEAQFFNSHGYNFYTYDHRTHGMSEGKPRSFIKDFENYIDDFRRFVSHTNLDGRPTFLFAHSFGGLVQVSFILDYLNEVEHFKGAMFSSPFLMPHGDTAPLLQKVSGVFGKLFPKLKTVVADANTISRDPKEIQKYNDDPLNYRDGIYAASGMNLIKQTKKVSARFNEIEIPFIIQHGTDDKLAELEGSKLLFKKAASTDKTFFELKDFKHEITRDIGFEKVRSDYLEWADKRI